VCVVCVVCVVYVLCVCGVCGVCVVCVLCVYMCVCVRVCVCSFSFEVGWFLFYPKVGSKTSMSQEVARAVLWA